MRGTRKSIRKASELKQDALKVKFKELSVFAKNRNREVRIL